VKNPLVTSRATLAFFAVLNVVGVALVLIHAMP